MTQRILKNSDSPPYIQGKIGLNDFVHHTGLYPDDVIKSICARHDIPLEQHKESLYRQLEYAAKRYALLNYNSSLEMPPSEARKQLVSLSRSAKKLFDQIHSLSPKAKAAYEQAEVELTNEVSQQAFTSLTDKTPELSRMEKAETAKVTIIDGGDARKGGEGAEAHIYCTDYRDIDAALKQIQLLCETAIGHLAPLKGGRPENREVFSWVKSLSDFWVKELKRPYRIDGYKGEVVTDAGNFLSDCLKPLDPTVINQLYSQMRRYRDTVLNAAA